MDTTSNIINADNIVSSDVTEIKIDDKFKTNYNLSDYDLAILETAVQQDSGQTDFQSRYFVANSQITPYKKVKQSLMELEVRYHAYHEIRASLRKAEIMRLKLIKQKDLIDDELDQELIQIDIDKNDYDITVWKRKLRQSEYEINTFLSIVKEHAKNPDDLEYYRGHNEEEERQYWIARMAKQAAMDIISFGRVGSGNMDSIAMMDPEDQLKSLTSAVEYSGLINAGLHKISVATQQAVDTYLADKSTKIPDLIDSVPNENLQLTAQPKVKPESI
jgi:hypothetical protein